MNHWQGTLTLSIKQGSLTHLMLHRASDSALIAAPLEELVLTVGVKHSKHPAADFK